MAVLIDTNALVFVATGSERLSPAARTVLTDPARRLLVSAVTAFEFADLNRRGRFSADLPLQPILDMLEADEAPYPPKCWTLAAQLPDHHRDPVDRMLVAHAIFEDHDLLTSDDIIRSYPVRTIW